MEEFACPRCKTTKYRNPSLKLLVNVCGHPLCENCVELLFIKGSANCPECGASLRRSGFRNQLFEDAAVEKEIDIRRRVLRDFTKRESDFATLREYNDYLEEVETIIFNLANNIDVAETNMKIEQYKKENKAQISQSKGKPAPDLLELEAILDEERVQKETTRLYSLNLEKEEKLRKVRNHEALIDDLMFSETDAKSIVEQHKKEDKLIPEKTNGHIAKLTSSLLANMSNNSNNTPGNQSGTSAQRTQFTSGIGIGSLGAGSSSRFLPVPKVEEAPLYRYKKQDIDLGKFSVPTIDELKTSKSAYLKHMRSPTPAQCAGGYHPSAPVRRYLIEAVAGLDLQPKFLHQSERMEVP